LGPNRQHDAERHPTWAKIFLPHLVNTKNSTGGRNLNNKRFKKYPLKNSFENVGTPTPRPRGKTPLFPLLGRKDFGRNPAHKKTNLAPRGAEGFFVSFVVLGGTKGTPKTKQIPSHHRWKYVRGCRTAGPQKTLGFNWGGNETPETKPPISKGYPGGNPLCPRPLPPPFFQNENVPKKKGRGVAVFILCKRGPQKLFGGPPTVSPSQGAKT